MKKTLKKKFAELINLIPKEVDEKLSEVTVTTRAVLGSLILLNYQQNAEKQNVFFASQFAISDMLNIDSMSVAKCLATLQVKHLITLVERGGIKNGKKVANSWNLCFDVNYDKFSELKDEEKEEENETEILLKKVISLEKKIDKILEYLVNCK